MRHALLTRGQHLAVYLRWHCRAVHHPCSASRHLLAPSSVAHLQWQPRQGYNRGATNIFRLQYASRTTDVAAIGCWQQGRHLSGSGDSQPPPTPVQTQPDTSKEKLAVATPKPSLAKRIWHEVQHYWNGMRLLMLEIRIASRIGFKYLRGKSISRREKRHFMRTVADLFRMVPFIFFIVVPFMEFLLPFYLKYMPFMLPSTFQQKDTEAEKLRLRLKAKLETAKFLQATLQEGFQSKSDTAEVRQSLEDFRKFVVKCNTAGRYASTDELLRFSRLFADELTLDNLERPQLAAICKLLEVSTVGTKALIKLHLEIRLRQLHADDQLIQSEGLDRLSVAELQAACRARGMRSLGLSEERLRQQFTQWLDLHLNNKVPTSLLLLSRSLHFPDSLDQEDMLRRTIAALPLSTVTSAEASAGGADNKTKLEALKSADRAIAAEAAEAAAAAAEEAAAPPAADAATEGVDSVDLKQLESAISQVAGECLLRDQELRDLKESRQVSAAASKIPSDSPEAKAAATADVAVADSPATSKAAARLSAKLAHLVGEIDDMTNKVVQERQAIERRIQEDIGLEAGAAGELKEQLLSLNDLQLALKRFQRNPDDDRWEKILPLLDEDNDGKIEIHHVTKVIEMLGSDNSRLSSGDLAKLLEALDKERLLMAKEITKDAGGSSIK